MALDRTKAGSGSHGRGCDASPAYAHGGGCRRGAWRQCLLALGQQGSVPRTSAVAQRAQPRAPSQLTPTEAPARSTHSKLGAWGWVSHAATRTSARAGHGACSGAALPPVTPVQLHWTKASWGPWEPQCCHLPLGLQCRGLGHLWGHDCAVLGYARATGTAPELCWAILEQCQSCRESNTGLYWDSTEAYWHNNAIVGQC